MGAFLKTTIKYLYFKNNAFDTMKLENLEDNNELTHYYSLKIISEIDNIVNQSQLMGHYMIKQIMDNSCCQEYIKDYSRGKFYKE